MVPIESHSLLLASNFERISCRFREIDALARKLLVFPIPTLFDAPSGGTPYDINVIYTSLKSAFNGLQFCR